MNIAANLSVPKSYTRKKIKESLIEILPKDFKLRTISMPAKPGSGRRRGNTWELKFCKDLSIWWSNGKDDAIFKKAGSTHTVEKGAVFGDVYAVKPEGFALTSMMSIELKVVKESRAETANLLCGKSKMFTEFWDQTLRQANMGKLHPVLVVKIDRYCTLVFNLFDTIGKIKLAHDGGRLVPLCTLDDWFDLTPEEFVSDDVFKQYLSKLR